MATATGSTALDGCRFFGARWETTSLSSRKSIHANSSVDPINSSKEPISAVVFTDRSMNVRQHKSTNQHQRSAVLRFQCGNELSRSVHRCCVRIHASASSTGLVAGQFSQNGKQNRSLLSHQHQRSNWLCPPFVLQPDKNSTSTMTTTRRSSYRSHEGQARDGFPLRDPDANPDANWSRSSPQMFYFAIEAADSMLLQGAPLEVVLRDGVEIAQRENRSRDVWLVMEPAFLDQHPGLAALAARVKRPSAAIVSTNRNWMLTIVKEMLPQAVFGKFRAPTASVPDPLKSSLSSRDALLEGGVWH